MMEENVVCQGSEPNEDQISRERRLVAFSQVIRVINIIVAIVLFGKGIIDTKSYSREEEGWMWIGISIAFILGTFLFHYFISTIAEISISLKRMSINQNK